MLIDALASLAISGSAAAAGGILPSHGRLSPAGVPQPGDVFPLRRPIYRPAIPLAITHRGTCAMRTSPGIALFSYSSAACRSTYTARPSCRKDSSSTACRTSMGTGGRQSSGIPLLGR